MKRILIPSCLLFALLGTSSFVTAEIPYLPTHHADVVELQFQCGDMETVIGNLTNALLQGTARNPNLLNNGTLGAASATNLFFATFHACECRARLKGRFDFDDKKRCVLGAAALAAFYEHAVTPDQPLSEGDMRKASQALADLF